MSIEAMKLALEALENASPAAWASRVDSDTMKSIWRKHAEALDGLQVLLAELDNASCKSVQKRLEAQQSATGEPFGYIHHFAAHDERGTLIDTTWEADGCADPLPHPTSPSMWKWTHCTPFYTAPQPAQATQAEVTEGIRPEDFTVDVVVKPMGGFAPVNTQGVRVTHKPTGISVTCDAARSQHTNRHQAFEKLSAILALRPERAPMTDEQRRLAFLASRAGHGHTAFMLGISAAEAHHFGIKPKDQA